MPTSPVAVKLSPYFGATGEMARLLDEAGADGLVLFNRFLQPDTDPETLTVVRAASLSTAAEVRLPLTWIALLSGRVSASLAVTTGVESATELTKYLLAGADVVMTASALLRHGPELLDRLCEWMGRKGYATVEELRGLLAVPIGTDETARERCGLRQRTTASQQHRLQPLVTSKMAPGDKLRPFDPYRDVDGGV
jgi:dihydroorotate dehydrogenase (fumarate)